jgi:hypothetical protein
MTDIPLIDFDPDKAQLDGFELIDLNTLFLSQETMAHQLQTPHRVDFHHLIYIEQARGRHLIDFSYYPYLLRPTLNSCGFRGQTPIGTGSNPNPTARVCAGF